MSKVYEQITPELREWIEQQHIFFVASAPLAADGLVNLSPKSHDSFRILGPRSVAYADLTGSGVETIAHARENGRICVMFCAFDGPPKIVRLQGTAEVITPDMAEWPELSALFTLLPGTRAIIRATLTRIADSCGWAIPKFDKVAERDGLLRWAENQGPEGLAKYRGEKNALSLDGLPGLDAR
jgi:hypothetical protein